MEGRANYFVAGESYPTKVQVAGYDSRDNKLYFNFDLETTKTVGSTQTATFSYFVEVFDGGGAVLGTVGSYGTPETVAGSTGAKTATVTNKEVGLTGPLTAAYGAIVTVKEVTLTP